MIYGSAHRDAEQFENPDAFDIARQPQHVAFAIGNAQALQAGEKSFVTETYGEPVSYLARPYPEQSRRMILARIRNQLAADEQRAVGGWLEKQGLDAVFMP